MQANAELLSMTEHLKGLVGGNLSEIEEKAALVDDIQRRMQGLQNEKEVILNSHQEALKAKELEVKKIMQELHVVQEVSKKLLSDKTMFDKQTAPLAFLRTR